MDEYGAAFYHRVVDHKLVVKTSFIAVDRFRVELDLTGLSVKFWRSASDTSEVQWESLNQKKLGLPPKNGVYETLTFQA